MNNKTNSDDDIECVYETVKNKSKTNIYNNEKTSSDSSLNQSNSLTASDLNDSSNKSDDSVKEDESEDNDAPSGVECLSRCKEFAEITGTDRALAMFYLQDNKWNLEKSINKYFESVGDKNKQNKKKVVACFDIEKLDEDERIIRESKKQKTSSNSCSSRSSSELIEEINLTKECDQNNKDEEKNKHFKIMSWNIDGLDKCSLENRTIGVVQTILKEKPDVVLLQEVINLTEQILIENLKGKYELISAQVSCSYYSSILVKKETCKLLDSRLVINFENSSMGRNLLSIKIHYKNMVKLCIMTSHLESTKEFSSQRVEQLRKCFNHMTQQEEDLVVIFGGDLNLRDSELEAIGGPPKNVYDIWESTGKRKECLYTWDCMRNTNLKMNGKFKPRCRFDRLFYRTAKCEDKNKVQLANNENFTLMPVYFELEGLEKLKNCGRFCSDHWAIQAYLQLETI